MYPIAYVTATIIVTGNPVDGFAFYGPFSLAEDANEWADEHLRNEEWWGAPLHLIKNEDGE